MLFSRAIRRQALRRLTKPEFQSPLIQQTWAQPCSRRFDSQQFGPFSNLPFGQQDPNEEDDGKGKEKKGPASDTAWKMFESAATTFASLAVLGLAGYGYHKYYKYLVLKKMHKAFEPGDPVLDAASLGTPGVGYRRDEADSEHWIQRPEQAKINAILNAEDKGHYFLLIGEKGTGKSSMLLEAMRQIDGEGISMFEAHADLEIFRIRLGKALDFEFHEDYIGSLFSIRGPRDTTALLDIERAFNKLEKVALQRRRKGEKPCILIINSVHLVRDDEDGRDVLELIQQRAEQWAASNLCTVVFNSDDYWVYERLKRYATRMEVVPVLDLPKSQAVQALRQYRYKYYNENPTEDILEEVYNRVGGRLTYLNRVAKAPDMLHLCKKICTAEKTWFLNKCWILGPEMDDDVMDEQKYSSAAMVLAKALVDKEASMSQTYDPQIGHILPEIPLHEARQIMTRADFIQSYDHDNIFTIDSRAMVRADSVPMMNAFREICAMENFDEHLEGTLERIGDIESLGRTRELTIKDLWDEGKYQVNMLNHYGDTQGRIEFKVKKKPEDGEGDGAGPESDLKEQSWGEVILEWTPAAAMVAATGIVWAMFGDS